MILMMLLRKLSKIYFKNGDPFNNNMMAINSELFDLKTIRNSCAHITVTTNSALDALASRILQRNCRKITVHELLMAINPNSPTQDTVLQVFQNKLEIIVDNISRGI